MARPTRTNAEYFYHPASFRNDRRVKAIRARFGACGYGLLMMLIETLTDADNIELPTDEMEIELLAGDLSATVEDVTALIQAAEKVGLFARSDAGLLKCPQLDEWLAPVFEKRNRARAASLSGQKSNAPWAKHTEAVFARDENKCKHCATTSDLTLDHIIPRSAGGSDEITNLQTLCSRCNSAKGVNLSHPVTVITPVENSTVENSTVQYSIKQDVLPVAANAAASASEKKIADLDLPAPTPLPANPAQEAATGGATDVATRKAAPRRKPGEMPDPPGFDAFWQAYPRKENRRAAVRAFADLTPESQATATAAVRQWFATRPDLHSGRGDFRPHPATWLNQTRFLDSTPQPVTHANAPNGTQPGNRYQTTRHAAGFGSFAVRPPGDIARQPTGGTNPVVGPHPLPGAAG